LPHLRLKTTAEGRGNMGFQEKIGRRKGRWKRESNSCGKIFVGGNTEITVMRKRGESLILALGLRGNGD